MDRSSTLRLQVQDCGQNNKEFKVERAVASVSETLRSLISETCCFDQPIPLRLQNLQIFEEICLPAMKAIHQGNLGKVESIINNLSSDTLAQLIIDTNYLDINFLLKQLINRYALKIVPEQISDVENVCNAILSLNFPRELQSAITTRILYSSTAIEKFYWHSLNVNSISYKTYGNDEYPIFSFCFSPDCKLLAGGSTAGNVYFFDLESDALVKTLKDVFAINTVTCLQFNKDGSRLAIGAEAGNVLILDTATDTKLITLFADTMEIVSMGFDFTSSFLATCALGASLKIWSAYTGDRLASFNAPNFCFSPNSSILAVNNSSDKIMMYDLAENKPLKEIQMSDNYSSRFHPICYHPEGTLLAVSFKRKIKIFDLKTELCIQELEMPTPFEENPTAMVCFSRDGKIFAALSCSPTNPSTKAISLWDTKTFNYLGSPCELSHYPAVYSDPFTFSPDNKFIATCFKNRSKDLKNKSVFLCSIKDSLKETALTLKQALFLAAYARQNLSEKKPQMCHHHSCFQIFKSIPSQKLKHNVALHMSPCSPECCLERITSHASLYGWMIAFDRPQI